MNTDKLRKEIAKIILSAYWIGQVHGETPYLNEEKELSDFLEDADSILGLPEMQELLKKAEQFDTLVAFGRIGEVTIKDPYQFNGSPSQAIHGKIKEKED